MSRASLLAIALLGCGRDVKLGADVDAGADAAADALLSSNPFGPGDYAMHVFDPPHTQCSDALTGMESAFAAISHADIAVSDGIVSLAVPTDTALAITGSPITSGWGQATLDLVPNSVEPTIWDAVVMRDFGAGPLGTSRIGLALAARSTTGMNPNGIDALVAGLYTTSDGTGACDVTFAATFVKL